MSRAFAVCVRLSGAGERKRRPTMRDQLPLRRISMKHFLPSTALALMIGLGSLTLGGNASAANKWDSLQPDRDEIVASLNVVELLKRHHYSKPPLDDARSIIIYDSYIKLLDPSRSYFTAADIAQFDKWKTQFDDFLKSGNTEPGFTIYKRYGPREIALGLRARRAGQGRRQNGLHHPRNLAGRPQGCPVDEERGRARRPVAQARQR